MSYLGSPYSNSYNQDYENEYEDDNFDDEVYAENKDPHDESDEDTEDASETDTGRHEEPLEIKEQMYQDKLASLKRKQQQLRDGTHYEYNKRVRKLESQYRERVRTNDWYKDYKIECVERDYVAEKRAAIKEFEDKKIDLRENLISDLEDKKKAIESERYTMELTGDSMEVKPVMTRKLRRRPNDPVPVPEKRRKVATAQITYFLDEKDIESDLKIINRGKVLTPVRKSSTDDNNSLSPSHLQSPLSISSSFNDLPLIETRIEDGKLLYEKRWFHRGQSVFVEGRDLSKYPANISAIGNDMIWVKKSSDSNKVKIYLSSLARGNISIKRRAS